MIQALKETVGILRQPVDYEIALSDAILHLSKLGVTALVSTGTGADDKDPDTVVVSVSNPYRIGLPAKELYGDENTLKKYEEVITQVISALEVSASDGIEIYHGVVEFEKQLAAASPDAEDSNDVEVSRVSRT